MEHTPSQIARCIRLAREGGSEPLNDLLSSHRNYLCLLAATWLDPSLRSKADPSDLVQEALVRAHRDYSLFRGTTEQEWAAWLRTILTHCLADLRRQFTGPVRAVERERSIEEVLERSSAAFRALLSSRGTSPSEDAQEHERGLALADALARLDRRDREVVILRSLRELEWSEVARILRRTPDGARMMWTRALRRLGEVLQGKAS